MGDTTNRREQFNTSMSMKITETIPTPSLQQSALKTIDTFTAIFALMGLIAAYIDNDLMYTDPETYEDIANYLRAFIVFTTLLTMIFLIVRARKIHRAERISYCFSSEKRVPPKFCKSKACVQLVVELLVVVVCPWNTLEVNHSWDDLRGVVSYHVSDWILVFMMLRTYLLFRVYEHYSGWTRGKYIQKLKDEGTKLWGFGIKSNIQTYPLISAILCLIFMVIWLSVPLKVVERGFEDGSGMQYITNTQWMLVITMTTVGYGDFYPNVSIGKVFSAMACMIGLALTSIVILGLSKATSSTRQESDAQFNIQAIKAHQKLEALAVNTIKDSFKVKRETRLIPYLKRLSDLKKQSHEFFLAFVEEQHKPMRAEDMIYRIHKQVDCEILKFHCQLKEETSLSNDLTRLEAQQNELFREVQGVVVEQQQLLKLVGNRLSKE